MLRGKGVYFNSFITAWQQATCLIVVPLAVPSLLNAGFFNGPDDGGRWQRATFKFFFLHIQGTSIGLVRTNHALLSLVDTNLA